MSGAPDIEWGLKRALGARGLEHRASIEPVQIEQTLGIRAEQTHGLTGSKIASVRSRSNVPEPPSRASSAF